MFKLTWSLLLVVMVTTATIMMSQQISAAPWSSYNNNHQDKYTRCLGPAKTRCNSRAAVSHDRAGLGGFKECIDREVNWCVSRLKGSRVDGSCVNKHTVYMHKREQVCLTTVTPHMCFWFTYQLPVEVCLS